MSRGSLYKEVSGEHTSPFLDTDELKMALRCRNVSGPFEKRAPGLTLVLNNASENFNLHFFFLSLARYIDDL